MGRLKIFAVCGLTVWDANSGSEALYPSYSKDEPALQGTVKDAGSNVWRLMSCHKMPLRLFAVVSALSSWKRHNKKVIFKVLRCLLSTLVTNNFQDPLKLLNLPIGQFLQPVITEKAIYI